ncbi:response regulator [Pyxidicoccus trucidator]|uniref:response regulator n=1 Tax=Pyxidicoccus trucidator TaxID=2709662 RepID=UPI0013DBC43F|nr:response regulator [Pyxidicoccus trucidator]
MRLLMVENHVTFAEIVRRQILGEHEVLIVPSLAAARERLREVRFDAVLVDFDLDDGKRDGLVRELKSVGYPGRIVAISSHEQGNAELLAAGAHSTCARSEFARIVKHLQPMSESDA